MTFVRLTSDSTGAILDFMLQHGDALLRKRVGEPDAAAQLFRNRSLYGRHDKDGLTALVSVAERTHLTWQGRMYFPFVILPDPTLERKRAALADFLAVWRAEESPYWRRMVIYDDTPGEDEAPFLAAQGFHMVRRHLKHVRELAGGPPPAEEFPRVGEALAKGYTLSMPTVADIEADAELADRLVALRNATFALRDNADRWTPAEMLRQMKLPGALMIVVWHGGMPVGLTLLFHIQDGDDKGEAYVSEIVIHRRHWGKVAADLLGLEMLRKTCAMGALTIAGIADQSNRASCNLMERFGLTVRKTSVSWSLDLPPSAPR
ncbi:GNAT family N-acetyltransferase [Shumkonia mesophila]|uniref:GNAT family N-acetyltransferase n=1 Tax=Shumkonia mesophila TaxID=2838854 RepID=UPI002934D262|nr:GNAT family N-acetyltransferase [Shumkonia mesophila]